MIQINAMPSPASAVAKKAPRQPNVSIRPVTSGGASAGPSVEAVLKTPVARPRTSGANQARTTLAPVGHCGASPRPRNRRATISCGRPTARPVAPWAADQRVSAPASSGRGADAVDDRPDRRLARP
ncbi:MAG: hypothetical protein WDM85_19145 [Caulobacteraceae bacterium]